MNPLWDITPLSAPKIYPCQEVKCDQYHKSITMTVEVERYIVLCTGFPVASKDLLFVLCQSGQTEFVQGQGCNIGVSFAATLFGKWRLPRPSLRLNKMLRRLPLHNVRAKHLQQVDKG